MNIIQTNFQYRDTLTPLDLSKVSYFVLHHVGAVTYTPEQCHADHLANGWLGAGYNAYIRKGGTIYIMRGYNVGAQCQGYNSISFGIAFEGDYSKEKYMPETQFNAAVEYIKSILPKFPNLLAIKKHKDLCTTDCPGQYFPFDKIVE